MANPFNLEGLMVDTDDELNPKDNLGKNSRGSEKPEPEETEEEEEVNDNETENGDEEEDSPDEVDENMEEEDREDEEVDGEEEEEEEDDRYKEISEQNAKLLSEMANMASKFNIPLGGQQQKGAIEKPESPEKGTQAKSPVNLSEIITEEAYEEAITSREAFVNLMGKVVEATNSQPQQQQQQVPDIDNVVEQRMTAYKYEREFYDINPDLEKFRPLVDYVADEIKQSQDITSIKAFFQAVEKEVRNRYGLTRPDKNVSTGKKPALPKKSKARKGNKKRSSLQKEIDEVLAVRR